MSNRELGIWALGIFCAYIWTVVTHLIAGEHPTVYLLIVVHICVAALCTTISAIEEDKRRQPILLKDLL